VNSAIIAFVSIFLGLTAETQEIEVSVGEQVARVEIVLDGKLAGTLDRAPWRLAVDFGQRLTPHRLEAVAYDAGGTELARVLQWVNMARSVVQAALVIEHRPDGTAYARLTWANPLRLELQSLAVSMDGEALEISDPESIGLPLHNLEQLHFLRAELEFADNVSAVAEVTFGGAYADYSSTDLTAVSIVLGLDQELPDVGILQDWFLVAGKPAQVAGVEAGPAEIIMIRDQGAQRALNNQSRVHGHAERFAGRLKKDQRLAFMWPFLELNRGGIRAFPPLYGWLDAQNGGLAFFMTQVPARQVGPRRQILADAVAVAGMGTLIRNRRRAVVLVLGRSPADSSLFDPSQVRSYLRDLHVPLFLWTPISKPKPSVWGELEDISSTGRFRAVIKRLSLAVERQRIVWINGHHLPQDITLAPGATAEFAF